MLYLPYFIKKKRNSYKILGVTNIKVGLEIVWVPNKYFSYSIRLQMTSCIYKSFLCKTTNI